MYAPVRIASVMLSRQRPLTICIPRIEASVSREYVHSVFSKLNIGRIERINEITLRNDTTYKRVMIKVHWNDTSTSQFIQKRLNADESVKLVHENPFYWKLVRAN
jgi:hypothetical protein